MSAARNIGLMGASTAVRLGLGMLSIVIMARLLGPSGFGLLMYWMSIATLFSLIANFGFTPYLLREIGASPGTAQRVMSEVLSAKLILVVAVASATVVASTIFGPDDRLIFLALMAAMLIDAITELFLVGLRATDRFSVETRVATMTSSIQLAIIGATLWIRPEPAFGAGAFLLSRACGFVIAWTSLTKLVNGLRPSGVASGIRRIRSAWAYALDFGLQSLFGQVDSIVLNATGGTAAVGIHQAGIRLFQAGAQMAPILSNVFLPRAAANLGSGEQYTREASKIQWAFVGCGALGGLVMVFAGKPLVHVLFGSAYGPLMVLMPLFGFLFYVKFCAAAWGVLLTASGKQTQRTCATAVHWAVIALIFVVLREDSINKAWLWSLLGGTMFLALSYLGISIRQAKPSFGLIGTAVMIGLVFVPFVYRLQP